MAHPATDGSPARLCGALLVASLIACPGGQGGTDAAPTATDGSTGDTAATDGATSTSGASSTGAPTSGTTAAAEPVICGDMPPDVSGFAICGAVAGDRAEGKPGGDVNGDGLADIIVETKGGSAYVVFGKTDTAPVHLAELADSQGITIDKSDSEDDVVVMPAGDVNGDGFGDLFVAFDGKYYAVGDAADAYVVFGGPGIHTLDLSALAPEDGRRLFAGEGAHVSWIEPLGDANGDGFADLAVIEGICCLLDINVVFGAADPQEVSEADVEAGMGGVVIARFSGTDVAAGDINGDGTNDIIVEAIGDSLEGAHHDGPLHVIFGGPDLHELDLEPTYNPMTEEYDPPIFGGYTIFGPAGIWDFDIATGSDINGDGLDDLALALDLGHWDPPHESVVVFGKTDTDPVVLPAALPDGAGFMITVDDPDRYIGSSPAPDLNGDGFADIALVAGNSPYDGFRPNDRVYVIFGKTELDPVVAGDPGVGLVFDAAPPGDTSGKFGGWAQVDGKGEFDLIVSTHEGDDDPPEPSRIFVYFDKTPG